MVKSGSIARLLAVFLLLTLLFAPRAGAADENPLKVLTLFPSGPAPRVQQFTVTFNQPMVPLGDMAQPPETAPMTIEPALPGQYRWLNVYTLAFEPETPLEGSMSGRITIKAGARSLAGAVLSKPVTTEFSLPPISLTAAQPPNGTGGLPLKPAIQIFFNQPVKMDDLQSRTSILIGKDKSVPCLVREDTETNRDRLPGAAWAVIAEPEQDLPKNAVFILVIAKGLASQSGPQPSAEEFRLSYRTYGPLKVTGVTGYQREKNSPYDPESGLELRFSNPVPVRDIRRLLKITPDYDLSPGDDGVSEEETAPYFWVPGPFKAETAYTLAFGPGLKDEFGQALEGPAQFTVQFGPARPVLDLPGREGVLEVTDNPAYPFQARNVKKVFARGYFLRPDMIVPFIIKNNLYEYLYDSPDDMLKDVTPADIVTAEIPVDTPANVMTYQPVRLNSLFGGDIRQGLMYFDLNAPETSAMEPGGTPIYRRALVQVTDLGLSAKFGLTNTLVWATDLKTGQPAKGVQLEIRNSDNHVLWRGESNEDGLALAPGADAMKVKNGNRPYGQPSLFVMGTHDGSFSVISSEWNQGIRPWNFGLSSREIEEGPEIMTWALTSLPLYKPGDDVQYKLIRRQNTAAGLKTPEETRLLVQIQDSRGKTIEKTELIPTGFGTASGKFTLPATAALGGYSIQAGPSEDSLNYVGSFQVEVYRKPTFAVDIQPSVDTAFSGDPVTADISAVYHFGSPVRNRPVQYVVTSSPAYFSLPRFEDYSIQDIFSDPEEPDEPVNTVTEGRADLDADGRMHIGFEAVPGQKALARDFMIEATVTDVDQRTVSQRKTVLVHPASFYLGIRTANYLVGPGESAGLKIIAARPDGTLLPGISADVVLYRRTWQTVRRKGVGGYYHYVSKNTDTLIERKQVQTGAEPQDAAFTVDKGGYYFVTVAASDEKGRSVAAATDFYAYGPGAAGWQHYDHDRIDLIPDKTGYTPGETATILVKSPFTSGTGLLTVERNGVRRYEIFKIDGSSPHLDVKLEEGDGPNVYVSVLLVRGRISEELDNQGRDPGKPAFKAGYAELKVRDDQSRLKVTVAPARPEARPGEEMEAVITVTGSQGAPQQAEVAVIVADAALLQLSSEDVYYPERLFFAPRPLAVWTSDIRLNLIGRRHYGLKGAKPGGGGLGAEDGPFRKKFVSLAYFDPHLVTDSQGRVTVKFTLPDNLTTFKMFAVANGTGDTFGTGVESIRITKPLLLKPGLPNFAGAGDRFMASVTVHNQTDAAGPAVISLSGENFELNGNADRTIDLKPRSSVEAGFPVRILGGKEAVFRFRIAMGDEKDAAEYRIPLRYPNSLTANATYGRLTESQTLTVKLPEGSDPARGGLSLVAAPSLAGSLQAPFDYLREYSHACLEQKTSKAMGDLLFLAWSERLGGTPEETTAARQRIEAFLRGLDAYQSHDGAFFFWLTDRSPDPWLTGYVVQFLDLARKSGMSIDNGLLDRALEYARDTVDNDKWPSGYSARAILAAKVWLVSVMAEAGREVTSQLENLYARRKSLSPYELALMLKSYGIQRQTPQIRKQTADLTRRLFARAAMTSGEVHFEDNSGLSMMLSSTVRTNALALRGLLQADPGHPHLTALARWLLNARTDNGHWGTTQNNAVALLALSDYIRIMEENPPDLTVKAALDGQTVAEAMFDSFNAPPMNSRIPADRLTAGRDQSLELTRAGTGAAYYTMRLEYAPVTPDLQARQAGIVMNRIYTVVRPDQPDDEIKPATTFQRGDLVKVEVTMLLPAQRNWVVLEDMVPAGLEPLNFNLPVAPEYLARMLEKGSRPEDYYRLYWYGHQEIRPDRVTAYARQLSEGVYTFSYLARAVTPGVFTAPGARAEEMYAPETSGRSEGVRIEIK